MKEIEGPRELYWSKSFIFSYFLSSWVWDLWKSYESLWTYMDGRYVQTYFSRHTAIKSSSDSASMKAKNCTDMSIFKLSFLFSFLSLSLSVNLNLKGHQLISSLCIYNQFLWERCRKLGFFLLISNLKAENSKVFRIIDKRWRKENNSKLQTFGVQRWQNETKIEWMKWKFLQMKALLWMKETRIRFSSIMILLN